MDKSSPESSHGFPNNPQMVKGRTKVVLNSVFKIFIYLFLPVMLLFSFPQYSCNRNGQMHDFLEKQYPGTVVLFSFVSCFYCVVTLACEPTSLYDTNCLFSRGEQNKPKCWCIWYTSQINIIIKNKNQLTLTRLIAEILFMLIQ